MFSSSGRIVVTGNTIKGSARHGVGLFGPAVHATIMHNKVSSSPGKAGFGVCVGMGATAEVRENVVESGGGEGAG